MLKKPEIIKNKLLSLNSSLSGYKTLYTNYNNFFLISQLEAALNIERFNFTKKVDDVKIEIDESLLKSINTAFNKKAIAPTTFNKFKREKYKIYTLIK